MRDKLTDWFGRPLLVHWMAGCLLFIVVVVFDVVSATFFAAFVIIVHILLIPIN